MKPPVAPIFPPVSARKDAELLGIISSPAEFTPALVDAAKLELWKRHDLSAASRGRDQAAPAPVLSSLAVYSLVLVIMPYFGLPLAIAALRRIAASHGRLRGRRLAWAAIVLNVAAIGFSLAVVALAAYWTLLGR